MADFRLRKINKIEELRTKEVGYCIECYEEKNRLGMPYVCDLNTSTVKTVAKMVYEGVNSLIFEKGYVARPTCGNMACINPKHIECIKV